MGGATLFPGGSREIRVWEASLGVEDGCSCHPVSVPGDTASLQKA